MADGYGDYGLMTNEPVLSLEEIIRRNRAIRARKDEIQRREDELRRLAEQQDASKLEDPGSVEGRQRHKEAMRKGPVYQAPTPKPKTVNVDGTDMPYDEAVSKIPDQMDFEQQLLSSPLAKRALRRRRIEDLVTDEGKSQEEAEQIALQEQQGRAAAFTLGQETIRNSPDYGAKEDRALGSGLTNSAISMGARVLGFDQVADEAEATRAGISSEMGRVREAQHPYPKLMGAAAGAAENAIQMLPGMISAPITGPAVGMALMSGQYGTQEYIRAQYEGAEAGLAGDELDRYALIQGGIEASIMPLFNAIPGMKGLEGRVLRGNIARGVASHPSVREVIASGTKLTKDTAAELAEEVTTEVLHGLTTENMLSQDVDYKSIVGDTVLQTLLLMGASEAAQQAGSRIAGGKPGQTQEQSVEPQPVSPDLIDSTRQPVDATGAPQQTEGLSIDEMIRRRDAAPVEQAPAIPPEVEAFTETPSRKKYDAAVKAGLPPIENPGTQKERAKYAEALKAAQEQPPQPVLDRPPTDPASLEPVSPETTSPVTEPDNEYDQFRQPLTELLLKKGEPNGQIETEVSTQKPEDAQGRQEGLLNEPEASPVATGEPSPDQSPESAGPVSKPETAESLRKSLNTPGTSSDMTRLGVLAQAQSAKTYEEAEAAFGDLTFADMQQFRLQPKDVLFHNFKISDADKSRLQAKYESPAGTQVLAPPAAVNESPTPAAHTRETFEKEYRDTYAKMMEYTPDQAGSQYYSDKMADLWDSNPEWAQEIEQTKTPPVVAPGGALPDQPSSPMVDPVSKMSDYLSIVEQESGRPPSEKFRKDMTKTLQENAINAVKDGAFHSMGGDSKNPKIQAKMEAVREYLEPLGYKVGPVTHNAQAGVSSMTIEPATDVAKERLQRLKGEPVSKPETPPEPRRGIVGDMLTTGEVVQTSSGRPTTPFPKIALDTSRKLSMTLRKAEEWLQSNALAEAESRGDDFNALQFRNEKPGKMPKAVKDSMEEYLFGEQPAVVPSILKPLAPTKPTKEQLSRPAPQSATPSIKPLPIAGNSLRSIVLAQGGISAKSLRKDYSQKNLKSDGLLGVMRIAGQPLDELAQMLESSGDLRVPEGRTAADYLLEQLKANADGARAQYSDAEIEAQLEAERKLYDQRQEYEFEASVLDAIRKRSEEAATLAVDAGEEQFVPFTESEAAEIIDTSFDFGANVAVDDKFELKRPEKPKPKAEDFGTNPNSKQGGLFDAGKKGDKKGQELLFNSDPGDLNNPRTQENKPKAPEPPAQSQPESEIEAAMAAELDRLEAEEAAAKKPKTPKAESKPAKTRKPRTKSGEKLGELSEQTGNARKDAAEAFLKKMKGLGLNSALGSINKEALTAAATMVRAYIADNTVKFADFVMKFAEDTSPEIARKFSDYLEAAWKVSGQRNSNLDPAGKVADILGPETETSDVNTTTTSDEGMGGMPGESGGTLAPETGSDAEGGNTENTSGPDGDAVPGGTDGTTEKESDGTGISTEGTGSKPGAGTKRKPGRKGSVRGSRKPSVRVPKQVGAPSNLRISPDDTIAPGGVMSKLKANFAAIKLLKELQAENRQATEAEQRVLMQYTGWGSLQHVFDKNKGEEFIDRPGLADQYGEWYKKSLMYQVKGEYSSLETLRGRVESWEKQWGEAYRFLKETLTPDEWKKAKASVLNAHFTSREVITNGIWGALEHFGITGGRFMEPSSGIGSLIGLMPENIANDSEVIAIELDSLTGDMVKQLYPEADVHVKGFEEVPIPAGTIDVAATNVPFHKIGPADAKTRYGRDMNLHNYFIARMLDSLRPGGIAAVITTHFTMDANPQDRALLASKADLVGAIRLPNSAFKANAGTEVTTDILFFRKPDGSPFKGESWQNLASVGTYVVAVKNKKGIVTGNKDAAITVNEYFAAHPEMVLGTHSMDGTQYSDTEYTVMPVKGESIAEQLQKAVASLPAGIANVDNAPLMPSMDTGTGGVEGRIDFRNGKLQELSKGEWGAPSWLKDAMTLTKDGKPLKKLKDETKAKKIADAVTQGIAYTKVRNAYEQHIAIMRNEATTQAEYEQSQKSLNVAYDAYKAKHGNLNDKASDWLDRDPGFFRTSGLETEIEIVENGTLSKDFVKADVFKERTVNPDSAPKKADTTEDAVKMSLAWRGAINLPWMSELTGTSEEDLETELLDSGTVFQNPETSLLEPADTYLSGNVQAKLRAAEAAVAAGDKRFEKNVELLKIVQPPKMTIDAITPSLGQEWIPHEVVNRWMDDVIKLRDAEVRYNTKADIWSISTGAIPRDVQNEWGTLGMHLSDLLPKVLNGSTIRVMKKAPRIGQDGRVRDVDVVDEAQTQAAQIKAQKLRDSFESWAKANETAIPLIEQAFNEQKNFYVKPQYNGEHLTFPGMSEVWLKRMRPYQKNTIWRAIREGRGMIAHGVGAGKTAEIIAIAMEMKRLGTATKPLIVVQNSTLGQFARTFNELYPAAKVLVASKDDLNPENRARFMARIATGNWDSIVMAKSTFNMKLPNDPALERAMVEGLISELEAIMLEAQLEDGAGSPSVKAIQQQINSLIKRLDKIIDRVNARTDSDVYFEQMGVDALFLDEAHDYKKPPFVTKMDRSIKGLATDTSGRALSALIKMRFIQGNNRGRNTFMATGTPITNTLGESWLLMNMVAPDVLKEFGVTTFDRFVATFARVISSLENNAVGKLQRTTRLAKFKNGHQLAQFIQSGWDVLLGSDLHDKIREYGGGKIPKIEGGKEELVMVDRSPAFDTFSRFFFDVYDAYKALEGEDKKTYSWVPVVIYGAAKAAAIDVRLVDPTATDDPGSKLNKMVDRVFEAYKEGTNVDLQFGDQAITGQDLTQLIFSDQSGRFDLTKLRDFAAGEGVTVDISEEDETDSGDDADSTSHTKEDRWLYNEIKRKLIEKGVPEEQVQLINDHNSKPEKLLAFQDRVSAGEVRIVIGHSDTLGTGVNVQPRLRHIWHLDIPMVPAKKEQRDGRGIRSGNMNDEVGIHVMAMQRSLDSNLMSMLLRKAKAAEQALSGKAGAEFEDPFSESLMSMADMEAAMNDDPLFYRQRELEFEIRNRRLEMEALDQQRSRERSRLRSNEMTIERLQAEIKQNESIANNVEAALKANHPFKIEGKTIESLKDAEKALKKNYDSESDRISKATQDSQIKALTNYYSPESDHVAADAEYGPIQFNLIYGERPEVVQDDKGNPSTKWTSTSGTLVTMGRKKIEETRATNLSSIMEFLKESVPQTRKWIAIKQKDIDEKTAENVKLVEFLAKPSETQIELENMESQLAQVTQLMFQRDNPTPPPAATPDPSAGSAEAPVSDSQKAVNDAQASVDAQKAENDRQDDIIARELRRRGTAGLMIRPITSELATALAKRTLGAIKLGAKQFDLFIKELRLKYSESEIKLLKPQFISVWNVFREKYDLDEATSAGFDEAMSNTVDLEIEQAIEAITPAESQNREPSIAEPSTPDPATQPAAAGDGAVNPPDDSRTITGQSPDDEPTIGINKAKRAERRKELGLAQEDIVSKVGHSFPELDAEAKKVSPGEAEDVFTRIGAGGEAADNASDRDVFVMLNHYAGKLLATTETLNERKAAQEAGDDFRVVELDAKLNVQIAEEARLMAIAKNAGTAAGRALAAFKALMKYDMSLARLRMRLNAASDGNPTDAQTQEQIDLHAKYEAALKELEAKTKEAEEAIARAEIAEQIARRMKEKEKRDKAGGKVKTKADRRLDAALEKLGKDLSFFSFTGAFQKLPQLIELAGALIEKNMERFEDFVAWTSKRWGKTPKPETLPVLRQAWDTAWEQEKNRKPPSPPKVSVERDIPDSLVNAAKILFRHFLEEGITNTEEVIDAVHSELQDQFPNLITERLDTMKAMVDYEKTITLSQDPLDILAADKRAIVQLKAKIADMQRGIAPRRSEQRYPASDEQRAHIKMFNEEKRKGGFEVTDPDRQAKSALASLETRLRHSISDTLNEIASGARTVPEKTVQPTNDTTEDLQAYLALVRGMHKDIFGDRTMTQEQRLKAAEAAAVKNEAYWNERLARAKTGDFSTGKTKPDPVTSANIAAIKARAELAKAQIQELKELASPKPSPEAISDARYLTSLQNQLSKKMDRMADIMARAAAGDFAPERNLSKEKREANAERRKKDAAIRDARIKLDETSRALNDQIENVRKKNLTYVDLAKRVPGAVWATLRDAKLTGELSFILRQGGPRVFGTLVPAGKIARAGIEAITGNTDAAKLKLQQAGQGYKQLGATLGRTLKAAFWKTDTELARANDALKQRPNYINGTYDAMRLSLHEDGGKYSVAEELFINNLIELGQLALDKRFPGFKGFRDGHPVFTNVAHNLNLANRISNATKVFMNELRADMADDAAALWTMKSGEMTAAESRILGKTVNAFTGKGDMSLIGMDGQKAQSALSKVLISAPWLMSRLQLMALHPLWSKGSTGESRKAAAEIYVDMAAGVAAYYGAFVLAGMFMSDDDDERPVVEWDSTSSDFMKVRIGKTRLDPLFGLQQVIVLTSRILHDEIKDSHGVVRPRKGFEDDWALISRFQEGRLHPAIQDIRSLKTGKDFMGNPITKTEVAIGAITPITYPDIVKASENRGVPASTAIAIWAMAGGGLATYDPRTKARADIVEELGIVQRKIQNQNTPADVRKSLQTDADKMLEEHLLNAVKHDMSYLGNTVVSEQLATREPGTPIAPELTEAIQKEKHDITLRALEMLSTEDKKKDKKPGEDAGISTARTLLRTLAPTYDEANALFEAAYKQRNGSLRELVGEKGHKRWQFKPSVTAARRRMKAIYETK